MPRKSGKRGAVRGETATIRISPRLKYAMELLARRQHRTISSVVLGALEDLFLSEPVSGLSKEAKAITSLASITWDPREPVRIVNLANRAPDLLTSDEEFIWTAIKAGDYRGEGRYGYNESLITSEWEVIRANAQRLQDEFGPSE